MKRPSTEPAGETPVGGAWIPRSGGLGGAGTVAMQTTPPRLRARAACPPAPRRPPRPAPGRPGGGDPPEPEWEYAPPRQSPEEWKEYGVGGLGETMTCDQYVPSTDLTLIPISICGEGVHFDCRNAPSYHADRATYEDGDYPLLEVRGNDCHEIMTGKRRTFSETIGSDTKLGWEMGGGLSIGVGSSQQEKDEFWSGTVASKSTSYYPDPACRSCVNDGKGTHECRRPDVYECERYDYKVLFFRWYRWDSEDWLWRPCSGCPFERSTLTSDPTPVYVGGPHPPEFDPPRWTIQEFCSRRRPIPARYSPEENGQSAAACPPPKCK